MHSGEQVGGQLAAHSYFGVGCTRAGKETGRQVDKETRKQVDKETGTWRRLKT